MNTERNGHRQLATARVTVDRRRPQPGRSALPASTGVTLADARMASLLLQSCMQEL